MAGSMGPTYVLDKSAVAGAAISQYQAVKFSDEETVIPCDTLNEFSIGVCQDEVTADDATNGRSVDVRVMGITYGLAGGALSAGDRVRVSATGRFVALDATAGTNNVVAGVALQDATADGDPIAVLLTPGATSNTATT